jgi:2,3-bisphosphoglycerate-dependent phosphoglycerate mutase
MTTLIVARHGNTFGPNDTVTYVGGRTDLPLVESGREQAKKIGAYLKAHKLIPDVIYASGLQRAQETAKIAVKESGVSNPVYTLEIFNEIDYGPDENKTKEDIVALIGEDALKAWDENSVVPPGWKVNPSEIIWNWQLFARTAREHDDNETILVVTSNGIARFAPHITGEYEVFRQKHSPKMATGALSIFGYDGAYQRWVLKHWNLKT